MEDSMEVILRLIGIKLNVILHIDKNKIIQFSIIKIKLMYIKWVHVLEKIFVIVKIDFS